MTDPNDHITTAIKARSDLNAEEIKTLLDAARAQEREACAKVAELLISWNNGYHPIAKEIAKAIRERESPAKYAAAAPTKLRDR